MPRDLTVADVGEAALLRRFRSAFGDRARSEPRYTGVVTAVGDDAAVLTAVGPNAVLTTDMLVEGVDFDWAWAAPSDVGHKAAAVNLSDLAAMGAAPRALLASVALRPADRVADVMALLRSLHRVGCRHGAPLVGGDLSSTTGPLVVSVTAVGQVEPTGVLPRHRGVVGDLIMVSGTLGAAAAALHALQSHRRPRPALLRRQLRPEPRVRLGRMLAQAGCVRACADVSDGLGRDALHLPSEGLGAQIDVGRLPIARAVAAAAASCTAPAWQWALAGGEDFELVVAVAPERVGAARSAAEQAGTPLTAVGQIVGRRGLRLLGTDTPRPSIDGFDHFGTRRRRPRKV